MSHPLEDVIRQAEGFLLFGESSRQHFPAMSFHVYTTTGKRFYCVDLDGLTESRGKSPGLRVYASIDDLPADRGDLAIIWTHPRSANRAVDLAHAAGCRRVWFSFGSGHRDAVRHATGLGMEVVEIGRCPVYFLEQMPWECRAHQLVVKASGTYGKPPQLDPEARHRELW